jgi:hypothetical protein
MRKIKITRACGTAGGSWAVDQIVDVSEMDSDIMDVLIKLSKAIPYVEAEPEPQPKEEPKAIKPKAQKKKTTKKRGKR